MMRKERTYKYTIKRVLLSRDYINVRHKGLGFTYMLILYLEQKDGKVNIVSLSLKDILKMRQFNKFYTLEDQSFKLRPSDVDGIERHLQYFIKNYCINLDEEHYNLYLDYAKAKMEYLRDYKNKNKYDSDYLSSLQFYNYYLADVYKKSSSGVKAMDFDTCIDHNISLISKEVNLTKQRTGGERYGWYTDEYDRKRPLTSPISYKDVPTDYVSALMVVLRDLKSIMVVV